MTLDTSTRQSSDHLPGPRCLHSQTQGAKQCYVGMFSTSGSVNRCPHSLVGHNVILLLEVEMTAPFLRVAQNVSSPLSLGTFGVTLLSPGPASFSKVETSRVSLPGPAFFLRWQVFTKVPSSFPFVLRKSENKQVPPGGLDTEQCADVGPLRSVNTCLQAASLAPAHVFPSAAELVRGRRWRFGGQLLKGVNAGVLIYLLPN